MQGDRKGEEGTLEAYRITSGRGLGSRLCSTINCAIRRYTAQLHYVECAVSDCEFGDPGC
jgi:hypothetical protein